MPATARTTCRRRLRRDRHRRRPQRSGHRGLPRSAGLRTLLVEARDRVGGTAASEQFAGATVNICNCDHLTFRTTPVIDELGLADHGLRYLDVEPAQHNIAWSGRARSGRTTTMSRPRSTRSAACCPTRSTATAATRRRRCPAIRMVLEAATRAPRPRGAHQGRAAPSGSRARRRCCAGAGAARPTCCARTSTHDALTGPGRRRRADGVGHHPGDCPAPGSARSPTRCGTSARSAVRSAAAARCRRACWPSFEAAGGTLRTSTRRRPRSRARATRVARRRARRRHRDHARRSSCRPATRTARSCTGCSNPPAVGRLPRSIAGGPSRSTKGTSRRSTPCSPRRPCCAAVGGADRRRRWSIAPVARRHRPRRTALMQQGRVLDRPGMLVNVPTVLDPTMAPADHPDRHVFSLEVLYTPYRLDGGWPDSNEPRAGSSCSPACASRASSTRSSSGGR